MSDDGEWRAVVVDGETFYWVTWPGAAGPSGGTSAPKQLLQVSRAPNTAGVGTAYPANTNVTEAHAIELVHTFKNAGREIP